MFDVLRQSYLLNSQYIMKLIGSGNLDKKQQHKLDFFTRQMVDAMSPENFAVTNPEVLKATFDSKGGNLVKGMKNLVRDLVEGKGKLKISMVDKSKFEVGKNIATTPGKVVFENDMMQLIQYTPTTEKVYKAAAGHLPALDQQVLYPGPEPEKLLYSVGREQGVHSIRRFLG